MTTIGEQLAEVAPFCCPLSKTNKVMEEPVILVGSGLTYERKSIEAWLEKSNTDPITKKELTTDPERVLVPNQALEKAIEFYEKLKGTASSVGKVSARLMGLEKEVNEMKDSFVGVWSNVAVTNLSIHDSTMGIDPEAVAVAAAENAAKAAQLAAISTAAASASSLLKRARKRKHSIEDDMKDSKMLDKNGDRKPHLIRWNNEMDERLREGVRLYNEGAIGGPDDAASAAALAAEEDGDDKEGLAAAAARISKGKWQRVAEYVGGGVTSEQCGSRFGRYLSPEQLSRTQGPWTADEVSKLKELVNLCTAEDPTLPESAGLRRRSRSNGMVLIDWMSISKQLNRPYEHCKHKWKSMMKSAQNAAAGGTIRRGRTSLAALQGMPIHGLHNQHHLLDGTSSSTSSGSAGLSALAPPSHMSIEEQQQQQHDQHEQHHHMLHQQHYLEQQQQQQHLHHDPQQQHDHVDQQQQQPPMDAPTGISMSMAADPATTAAAAAMHEVIRDAANANGGGAVVGNGAMQQLHPHHQLQEQQQLEQQQHLRQQQQHLEQQQQQHNLHHHHEGGVVVLAEGESDMAQQHQHMHIDAAPVVVQEEAGRSTRSRR